MRIFGTEAQHKVHSANTDAQYKQSAYFRYGCTTQRLFFVCRGKSIQTRCIFSAQMHRPNGVVVSRNNFCSAVRLLISWTCILYTTDTGRWLIRLEVETCNAWVPPLLPQEAAASRSARLSQLQPITAPLQLHAGCTITVVSRFGLAVKRSAGKQKGHGSVPLRLSFYFKCCGLWTLL